MKRFDKIVRFVIIFALGACSFGFINSAVDVYSNRAVGNIGGEVLILPLIIALVALGWQIKANLHK